MQLKERNLDWRFKCYWETAGTLSCNCSCLKQWCANLGKLHSSWWRVILVGSQYVTCFRPHFWHLNFQVAS